MMRPAIVLLAAALGTGPSAAAVPPPLVGTYQCHTGSGPFILALGTMVVTGHRYVVTGPQGHKTAGTYAVTPRGYRWSGDVGAVKHDQLADSEPEPVGEGFVIRYALGHTSPVSITCRRG